MIWALRVSALKDVGPRVYIRRSRRSAASPNQTPLFKLGTRHKDMKLQAPFVGDLPHIPIFYYLLKNPKRITNENPYITLNKEDYCLFFGGGGGS